MTTILVGKELIQTDSSSKQVLICNSVMGGSGGNSEQPLLSSKEKCDFSINPANLWRKLGLKFQSKRTKCASSQKLKSKKILMKRRARFDRCVRPRINNPIEKKVRILEKLIPNCTESMGVERLFRETADYIVALQMRVKVMQIMVDALSSGSDDDDDDDDDE